LNDTKENNCTKCGHWLLSTNYPPEVVTVQTSSNRTLKRLLFSFLGLVIFFVLLAVVLSEKGQNTQIATSFIGLASLASWLVFGILWIISLVRKNGKAVMNLLISISCFVLLIVAFNNDATPIETSSDVADTQSEKQVNNNSTTNQTPKKVEDKVDSSPLSKQEFEELHTTPKKFKGRTVEFYAKVFTTPERDKNGVYVQAYADPINRELNTIIGYNDPNFVISSGDYIHVVGTVSDEFKGTNMMGGTITAPMIIATKFELSDYITAVSPTIKSIEQNETIEQHGYKMNLDKVEFAENETRVYLTITNDSKESISFYTFNAKAVQGTKQYEIEHNWEADYKEPQSDILPGVVTDGIVLFEGMDIQGGDVRFIFEGRSDNWSLDFKPFEFNITP